MKLLVLVNPSSNGGRALRRWRTYAPLLAPCEWACVVLRSIDEAREQARQASGVDAVVAVGGDGTINAVADGVLKNPDQTLKFGVLYAGTSPDFCRFHGIPTDRSAVAVLKRGAVRQVPVLMANGDSFFCSCNLGMGAAVAVLANRIRPWLGDHFGTFCALAWGILRSKKRNYRINGELFEQCNHLLITRMPYLAGGLRLRMPELEEGEWLAWYVRNLTPAGWLRLIFRLYRGEACGTFRVFSGRGRVTSDFPAALEFDGDPHGTLPLELTVAEKKLNLICGERCSYE